MRTLTEYAKQPTALADLLPWAALIHPFVILNKNGSLQSTITYRGPDLDSSTPSSLVAVVGQLNNQLRRFGDGYALHIEAQRNTAPDYPDSDFPELVTGMIDDERRAMFEQGKHFQSSFYLTITYLSEPMRTGKVEQLFFEDEQGKSQKSDAQTAKDTVAAFAQTVSRFAESLQLLADVRILADSDLLTYLHTTVSTKEHRIALPGTPMYLDAFLTDVPITGGLNPKLGAHYIHTLTVRQFPTSSFPGMLDALNRLGYKYRWVSRFIYLGKEQANKQLEASRSNWFGARKGFLTMLREIIFQTPSTYENTDAVTRSHDADAALQELQGDHVSYGFFTQSLVLTEPDKELLASRVAEVVRIIEARGFVVIDEIDNRNGFEAWLGTIPGIHNRNVRYPIINTVNLAHLMPISAVWAGPAICSNDKMPPNSPVLFLAQTNNTTPFRVSNFVGDVGHAAFIGPPGAGKDVLLNLCRAQWMRYPNAQVFTFDKGASSLALTQAVGGTFYDLAGETQTAFQPLAEIHQPAEAAWAIDWLEELLTYANTTVTPQRRAALWAALKQLASIPKNQRTMTGLAAVVQDQDLKLALQPYTLKGPMGRLLDADSDTLQLSRWVTFEMEELLKLKSAVGPVLSYLFHRLDARFNAGAPTLLILNEAWIYLDNEQMKEKIKEWLKVVRKANVSVVFATQNISDFLNSSIADVVMETCMTRIFLPNPAAEEPQVKPNYIKCGLNDKQIAIIRQATPKRDYYITREDGNRLFQLELGPIGIAYCAATNKDIQPMLRDLQNKHGNDLRRYNAEYLRARANTGLDVGFAADLLSS